MQLPTLGAFHSPLQKQWRVWVPFTFLLTAWLDPAYSLGFGPTEVHSPLGKPLHVMLPLLTYDANKMGADLCLKTQLFHPDRTPIGPASTELVHPKGIPSLKIWTHHEIHEPAVVLVVGMGCRTVVQREYALLLDPVGLLRNHNEENVARSGEKQDNAQSKVAMQSDAAGAPPRMAQRFAPAVSSNVAPTRTGRPKETVAPAPRTTGAVLRLSSGPDVVTDVGESGALHLMMSPNLPEWRLYRAQSTPSSDLHKATFTQEQGLPVDEGTAEKFSAQLHAMQERVRVLENELGQRRQDDSGSQNVATTPNKGQAHASWKDDLGVFLFFGLGAVIWLLWRTGKMHKESRAEPFWVDSGKVEEDAYAAASTPSSDTSSPFYSAQNVASARTQAGDFVFPSSFDSLPPTPPAPITPTAADVRHTIGAKHIHSPHNVGTAQVKEALRESANAVANLLSEVTARSASLQVKALSACGQAPGKHFSSITLSEATWQDVTQVSEDTSLQKNAKAATAVPYRTKVDDHAAFALAAAEELSEITEVAEFWMALNKPEKAIEVLEAYTSIDGETSPVALLYLLELYRTQGAQQKYTALRERFRTTFNSQVPAWGNQPDTEQLPTLANMAHLMNRICAVWQTRDAVPFLKSLLVYDRQEIREGFALPVYREILFLLNIAEQFEQEFFPHAKAHALL